MSADAVAARRGRPLAEVAAAGTRRGPGSPSSSTVTQRHDLIDLWTTMFTDVYVHYTQKRALYGFDPIRALARCAARSRTSTRRGSSASSRC